ncbi:hypothetical protein TWF696_002171 [Orbilia brochopaga]|uniref:GCS light chain n=1 Tax=Orbilia brochopaga TaxID=3140254 RepID=A0AAV9U3J3_9PEZI
MSPGTTAAMTPLSSAIIFSTGNIIKGGRSTLEKSNRELINSLRQNIKDASTADKAQVANGSTSPKLPSWFENKDDVIYVPGRTEPTGLGEERAEYDITVKLFYLPGIPIHERCAHTRQALDHVLQELGVSSVDLLIASFPDVSFDAEDHSEPSEQAVAEWTQAYRTLEELHLENKIKKIGLAEFGATRLSKLLPHTNIKPSVDQINVRDCCVVPKPLIQLARAEKIELLTHNDCTDILPSAALNSLLQEDSATFGSFGRVGAQWVVKYTAVIQDRGVVENKGYFAMAKPASSS